MSVERNLLKLNLLLEQLSEKGFQGQITVNYGKKGGPKHVHLNMYLDLDSVNEQWLRKKLKSLGEGLLGV